jgi:hypothetical protein
MSSASRAIFIAAQRHPLDCRVIDINFATDGLDKEFEISLG